MSLDFGPADVARLLAEGSGKSISDEEERVCFFGFGLLADVASLDEEGVALKNAGEDFWPNDVLLPGVALGAVGRSGGGGGGADFDVAEGAEGRELLGVLAAGEADPLVSLDAAIWLPAGVLARDVDVESVGEAVFFAATLPFPNQSLNSRASSPCSTFAALAFSRSLWISSIVRVSRLFTLSLMSIAGAAARRWRTDSELFESASAMLVVVISTAPPGSRLPALV